MPKLLKFGLILLPLLASPSAAQWYQGPSGGKGGDAFDLWTESGGPGGDMSSVGGIATDTIRCLTVGYRTTRLNPGRFTLFSRGFCPGGAGSLSFTNGVGIQLDPDEYLLGVDGTFEDHINSIRFYTNKRQSDVFGKPSGRSFGYTAPSGQMIVALIGRAGDNLDAIGVMYAPCAPPKACR